MTEKKVDPISNPEAPGNAVIAFEAGDIPHVLSQIARLGEGLKAEFDLIAGRMSWLVIAESFISSGACSAHRSWSMGERITTSCVPCWCATARLNRRQNGSLCMPGR
jgi:hypothetical protein